MMDVITSVFQQNGLLVAFAFVGGVMYVSYWGAAKLTRGRFHGSALAILVGLAMAYFAGRATGGVRGVADLTLLSGVGLMGGAMLRDFAIIATAFGVRLEVVRSTGSKGLLSLAVGIVSAFVAGVLAGYAFGYRDAVSLTTIGAGAITYIVGPVTGTAIGASSEVIALSVAAGLVKAILVMTLTPMMARVVGLDNPQSAMIFGGIMGTTSGVAAGLAAVDPKLVPYGAMTAAFYTALGCLLGPSLLYFVMRAIAG